jgi:hypothetical protein
MSKDITIIDLTTLNPDYWRAQDGSTIETIEERSNPDTFITSDYLIIGFGGTPSIEIYSISQR